MEKLAGDRHDVDSHEERHPRVDPRPAGEPEHEERGEDARVRVDVGGEMD
jgi:hypothetical protein